MLGFPFWSFGFLFVVLPLQYDRKEEEEEEEEKKKKKKKKNIRNNSKSRIKIKKTIGKRKNHRNQLQYDRGVIERKKNNSKQ